MTKITKKTGRPPANIEEYFTRILPYLNLGLSIHKSCNQADIPYTTVIDYYNQDESFRRRVDKAREDLVVKSRAKLVEAVDTKKRFSEEHKYVLDNLDEDFKKNMKVGVENKDKEGNVTRLILDIPGLENK